MINTIIIIILHNIAIIITFVLPSVVKIPRAKNMKLKSKVGMARGRVLHRRKQSSRVIKTELKRCTMTESLWNEYDISRKSPEVPVKHSAKLESKERAHIINFCWNGYIPSSGVVWVKVHETATAL